MNQSDFLGKLDSIENLPSLPLVVKQIQVVMKNPNASMNQIAAIISKDQALASNTIRLVNSAFYGIRERVSSIRQAIVILGLNTVHNLLLGLSFIKMFGTHSSHLFDHMLFWKHALACGLLAKNIGRLLSYKDVDECFISGLLHDLGRLIFDQYFNKEFTKALQVSKQHNLSLSLLEKKVFTRTHSFTGAYIAKEWNIPNYIIHAMKYHHSLKSIPPDAQFSTQLVFIISKANQIANQHKIGNSYENYIMPNSEFGDMQISDEDIEVMVSNVNNEINTTLQEWMK